MSSDISPDNEQFIHQEVAAGHYRDRAEALDEAVRLLRRKRQLLEAVQAGVDQLERGEYVEYDITERERFLADIRRRAASGRSADEGQEK